MGRFGYRSSLRILKARRPFALVVFALAGAALFVGSTPAHVKDGTRWTYRYYTHSSDNPRCSEDVGRIDPLNIIYYQYGEALRINDHSNSETHWYGETNRRDQVMCVNPTGSGWSAQGSVAEEQGHGCLACPTRAHLRIFPAGHVHNAIVDKWSTADVHHEDLQCCVTHDPDESWELWEEHYASEFDGHNIYPDYYDRVGAGYFRGEYDNGDPTRVGGLHNGNY
jgi:hypothetical protein